MRLLFAVGLACYLATAMLVFFASIRITGSTEGGYVAIDVFFFYLPDSWRAGIAEAMFSALGI